MTMTSTRKNLRSALIIAAASAGLLTAPAFAADAAKPASNGVAATVNDAATTTKVKAKLLGNSALNKSDISVSTFNGVVALSGVATTAAAKAHAEADAKSIANVKSVDASALTVAGN